MSRSRIAGVARLAFVILFGSSAAAEEPASEKRSTPVFEIPAVTVVGSSERARELPGSAAFVDVEEIREQGYDDVNRALRRVPGVYLREEDGFGLFPNVSLRGVDTTRSAKVTVMEDGVLTAPAPYAAPSAYYSPTTGRMAGIEILKGSSQIRFGPQITGGVINYLSTAIPEEQTVYSRTLFGDRGEIRAHVFAGDTYETRFGRFGLLLEGYYRESDGFKRIDEAPDFTDGTRTGFENFEPMLKLAWEPGTRLEQRFEIKVGYTDRDADETYLGLSDEDFDDDPDRRYSSSRFDKIRTEQFRMYARHTIAFTDDLDLTTTGYYAEFRRNWFKLNDLRAIPGVGNLGLSPALAGAADGIGLAVLRGEAEGTLRVRNNNREYYLAGVESIARARSDFGGADHLLSAGVRYHWDEEDRFQRDELFRQAANGAIVDYDPGVPGDAGDRLVEARAIAVFVEDSMRIGALTVTPGVRFEHVRFDSNNRASEDGKDDTDLSVVAGGAGATYDLTDEWRILGGVFRGFGTPDAAAAVSGLEEETSLGFEAGVRHTAASGAFTAEAIGFHTRFDDLIVIENVGGTGSGLSENVGRVDSTGAELAAAFDPGILYGWTFQNPWFLAFTYTNAELQNDSNSVDAESIFAGGKDGNDVPYIPEYQLSFGVGLERERYGVSFVGNWVDETFTTASNTSLQLDAEGGPDARFGKTDRYFTADASAFYRIFDQVSLIGGVQNAFDDEYIVSRHPHGPRAGQPRFFYGGLEIRL
jgi:Fe(3+) dicitrate transport protein